MNPTSSPTPREHPAPLNLRRALLALALFTVSFGYVEAAVVAYLREIYQPLHARLYPDRASDDLFPLITLDQLRSEGPHHIHCLNTELVREAATLIMLAAAALAVAPTFRTWLAAFSIVFGLWDISFYAFLKLLLDWPNSLLTWDLLFLLPVPWVGPVLAPVLVSLAMIAAGTVTLYRESAGQPIPLRTRHWLSASIGGLLIVLAFGWDFPNTSAGRDPNPFHWPLFALGLAVGLTAFLHAAFRNPSAHADREHTRHG